MYICIVVRIKYLSSATMKHLNELITSELRNAT